MRIMICLDDHDGFLFNKRRQSLDREVHRDMVNYAASSTLWMSAYSYKSFAAVSDKCCADDNFWELAEDDAFCFVEDSALLTNLDQVSEIIIYRWNRVYPSDVKFPTDMLENWCFVQRSDFPGHSHEKITREVYRR